MPSIDAINCNYLHGDLPMLVPRVRTWQVPGVDGYGAELNGLGGGEFSVRVVLFGSYETTEAWAGAIEATVGRVVEVIDAWNTTHTVLIKSVGRPTFSVAWPHGRRAQFTITGVVTQ